MAHSDRPGAGDVERRPGAAGRPGSRPGRHRAAVRRARRLVLAVGLLAALVAVAACGRTIDTGAGADPTVATPAATTPRAGGRLVLGLPAETNGWNPALDQWADAGHLVASAIFEPLAVQGRDGAVTPYLAQAIDPTSPALDRWRITLRPGVRFHDGLPLDADALKRNLDFYTNEQTLTSLALAPMIDHVEVTGPLTVEVVLRRAWSAFPAALAVGQPAYVMSPSMISFDAEGRFTGDRDHPIGTGPFKFVSWERGSRLLVTRNPDYRVAGQPLLDGIEFRVLPDAKDRVAELEAGRLDLLLTTRADDTARLADRYSVARDDTGERTFVLLNSAQVPDGSNPFANVHARRALALATDRRAVADGVGPGVTSSTSPFDPSTVWAMDDAASGYPGYDPEAARREVEAFRAETGKDRISFTFAGLDNLEDQAIMQRLQEQWAAVGIEAKLVVTDQPHYIGPVALGYFQAAYWRSYNYRDPDTNYVFWHSSTAKGPGNVSLNFSQLSSAFIDEKLAEARRTPDLAGRRAAYQSVARERNAQVSEVWLFNTPYALIGQARVHGLEAFTEHGFANFDPKPWFGSVWVDA